MKLRRVTLCSWVTPTPCLSCTPRPALPVFSLALEVRGQRDHMMSDLTSCACFFVFDVFCMHSLSCCHRSFFFFYIFCRAGERGWSVHPGFREGDKHLSASNSTLPHTGVPARGAVPYPIITSTCRKWAPHQRRDPSPAEEPHTLQQRHGFHRPEGLGDSKANMIRIAINDTMGIYFYLLHFRFWAEWLSHLIGYNVIFWFVFVFSGVHRLSLVYIFHPHFPHLLYPLQSQTCATVSREKVCKIVCTFSLCLLVTLE